MQLTDQKWLTREQVMEYLQVGSHNTLRKMINEDGLPVHKLRNEMRFDRGEVDAWLKSRCISSGPAQGASDQATAVAS